MTISRNNFKAITTSRFAGIRSMVSQIICSGRSGAAAYACFIYLSMTLYLCACNKNQFMTAPAEREAEPAGDSLAISGMPVINKSHRVLLLSGEGKRDITISRDSILLIHSLGHFHNLASSSGDEQVYEIKPGDIIVADRSDSLPQGILAKVTGVSKESNGYQLKISNEDIGALFLDFNISWTSSFDPLQGDIPLIDIPVGPGGAKLTVKGSYNVQPVVSLALDVKNGQLTNTKVQFTISSSAALKSSLGYVEALTYKEDFTLKEIPLLKTVNIKVGNQTVPLVVSLKLVLLLKVNASGKMEVTAEVHAAGTSEVKYESHNGQSNTSADFVKDFSYGGSYNTEVEGSFRLGLTDDFSLSLFASLLKSDINLNTYFLAQGNCTDSGLLVKASLGASASFQTKLPFISTKEAEVPLQEVELGHLLFDTDNRFCIGTGNPEPTEGSGGATGDVHVMTFDNQYHNNQACGEFTNLASSYNNLLIQVRQGPREGQTTKTVTFNRAIAIRSGLDTINFRISPLSLYVNGVQKDLHATTQLSGHGQITTTGSSLTVQSGTGDKIDISYYSNGYFDYTVSLIGKHKNHITGLLGNWNGNPSDDLQTINGMVINPNDFTAMYPAFPNSWRITQQESLFRYDAGTSTATYTDYTYPSADVVLTSAQLANAQTTCMNAGITQQPALCNCITDVSATLDNQLTESAGYAQQNFQSDELIIHLPFDGDTKDLSSWQNNAVLAGTPAFTIDRHGMPNSALLLDGKSYASIPNNPSVMGLNNTVTVAGWILMNNWYNGRFGSFTCKANIGHTNSSPLQVQLTPSNIGSDGVYVNYSFALNTWYHVAMVLQSGIRTYYINGVKIGSVSQPVATNTEPLDIGRDLFGSAEYQIGVIDDYYVYNRALNDAEIVILAKQ